MRVALLGGGTIARLVLEHRPAGGNSSAIFCLRHVSFDLAWADLKVGPYINLAWADLKVGPYINLAWADLKVGPYPFLNAVPAGRDAVPPPRAVIRRWRTPLIPQRHWRAPGSPPPPRARETIANQAARKTP